MRKVIVTLALAGAALLGASMGSKAQAQEYPNVASLTPFSQGANYMSLPGYLRWQYLQSAGRWISREQAVEVVRQQNPTG
jgi:hypothetical protein